MFCFDCGGCSLLCGLLSSCCERGLFCSCSTPAFHCDDFSCGAQVLGHAGSVASVPRLQSVGSIVGAEWAYLLRGMWNLPGPGIEPASPTLAGGLFTTETSGEPIYIYIYFFFFLIITY